MKLNKLQRLISSKRTLSRIEGRICTTIPDEGFDFKACKSLWSAVHPTNQILHEIHLMAKHQNSMNSYKAYAPYKKTEDIIKNRR